jgi:hypothetical protein
MVPLAEFESATFCSASKRSIQLRYRGLRLTNIPRHASIVKQIDAKKLFENSLSRHYMAVYLSQVKLRFGFSQLLSGAWLSRPRPNSFERSYAAQTACEMAVRKPAFSK